MHAAWTFGIDVLQVGIKDGLFVGEEGNFVETTYVETRLGTELDPKLVDPIADFAEDVVCWDGEDVERCMRDSRGRAWNVP